LPFTLGVIVFCKGQGAAAGIYPGRIGSGGIYSVARLPFRFYGIFAAVYPSNSPLNKGNGAVHVCNGAFKNRTFRRRNVHAGGVCRAKRSVDIGRILFKVFDLYSGQGPFLVRREPARCKENVNGGGGVVHGYPEIIGSIRRKNYLIPLFPFQFCPVHWFFFRAYGDNMGGGGVAGHFQLGALFVADAYAQAVNAVGQAAISILSACKKTIVSRVSFESVKQYVLAYSACNFLDRRSYSIIDSLGGKGRLNIRVAHRYFSALSYGFRRTGRHIDFCTDKCHLYTRRSASRAQVKAVVVRQP